MQVHNANAHQKKVAMEIKCILFVYSVFVPEGGTPEVSLPPLERILLPLKFCPRTIKKLSIENLRSKRLCFL